MDQAAARLRLWQDVSLSSDVDLDAVARRHPDDDDVLTLVDLARSARAHAVVIAVEHPRAHRRRRA